MFQTKNAQTAKAELSAIQTYGSHSICHGSSTANRDPDGRLLMHSALPAVQISPTTIAGMQSIRITYQGRVICLTQQLTQFYNCTEKNIHDNHANNRDRFEEGKHFIKLEGAALQAFKEQPEVIGVVAKRAAHLILWTERGAARHAKMLETDKAWDVFEQLEEAYFRSSGPPAPALPNFADPVAAARAWADAKECEQIAVAQLALAAPKVVYADAMLNADGTVLVRDAAKTIGVPVRKLEKALRDKGVILPGNGPAAKYVTQGYLVESLSHYETNTRGRQISRTTRVTGKGLEFLRRFAQRHEDILTTSTKKVVA